MDYIKKIKNVIIMNKISEAYRDDNIDLTML